MNQWLASLLSVSITLSFSTGSCTASLSQVEVLCQSDTVLVVWAGAGSGMGEYMAMAEDGQGRMLNCTSANSSCEISGLRCGQLYNFSVTGLQCESQPSNTIQKYSGKAPE